MHDWFGVFLTVVGTSAGVYAAIKADLAALHVKADEAMKAAHKAHRRIDHHIGGSHEKA